MFKVKNNAFYVTRGDSGSFLLSFKDYKFKNGDTIEFKIYEKNGLDSEPILIKEKTVQASGPVDNIKIELFGGDTLLGEIENKVVEYWYEVILNGDKTVFCYDERGPKIFYLYPGGLD